jgi:hypothetical protein
VCLVFGGAGMATAAAGYRSVVTSPSTDPQPENTPGLEPGNSVAPGDTPPGEASTSGNTFREPDLPSKGVNWTLGIVLIGVMAVTAILLAIRLF